MERGAEWLAGMVFVPDPVSSTGQALSGGLVRWLVGRATAHRGTLLRGGASGNISPSFISVTS